MTPLKSRKIKDTPIRTVETMATAPILDRQDSHPLDKVIGVFRDEPLMDALMDRVRDDRRTEQEAEKAD